MKKLLLLLSGITSSGMLYAQFAPDNLVAVKNTPTAITTNRAATISLVELTTAGAAVSETTVGSNNFYVGMASSTNNNGNLTLSTDNKYLTMYGYSALPSSSSTNVQSTTDPRAVMVVGADQTPHIITIGLHSGTQARSAVAYPISVNSYGIYLGGGGSGGDANSYLQYAILNTSDYTLANPTQIAANNTAGVKIFNGQLYNTSPASPGTLNKIGDGLPTTTATPTGLVSSTTPVDFVMFGNSLLYVADETTGILKFYSNDGGTTWSAAGSVNSGITGDEGIRFMTGRLEDGKVTLYAVTALSQKNSVVKIVDETSSATTISNGTSGVTISTLNTLTGNNGYRGIAFTPNSTVTLPVSLASFSIKAESKGVVLKWSTASEQNNSHFDVLRSTDGVTFTKIGEVAASSSATAVKYYSFTDISAQAGVNYYQLKQVDYNGDAKLYGPYAANVALTANDVKIHATDNAVEVLVSAISNSKTQVSVMDLTGKKLAGVNQVLNQGSNKVQIPVSLNTGVYVVELKGQGISYSQKIIKN
ncbi:T9SS type A sorting domain-containing protein [Pedobacter sp. BS3]|uniref:T9SS type A sorting domain-containing protein n=1 Tax=Pedobacter sp. BS3 TaxID=2567937 RepID=UPI0016595656|nr:T9SS type A sorting domain-containing protein [Pedobacter sp. BS3]